MLTLSPSAIRLPDFIGIGAEKCATSWLFRILNEHPEIYLPKIKEVRFYDNEYSRGIEWYTNFFSNTGEAMFVGEISPQYFHDPMCASRIAETLPTVKLILILRNPIDRAYSQYWMDVRTGEANGEDVLSFSEAIEKKPEYLRKGLYNDQLAVYLSLIERKNILVLLQDDIEKNPMDVCMNVYSFIGANETFVPAGLWSKENVASNYKYPGLFRFSQVLVRLAERIGMNRIIIWFKNNGIRDWFLKKMKKQIRYPAMEEELRLKLKEYYSESNKKLAAVLKLDLSGWD